MNFIHGARQKMFIKDEYPISEVKLIEEKCNNSIKRFPMNHNQVDFKSEIIMGSKLSENLYRIVETIDYRKDWKQLTKDLDQLTRINTAVEKAVNRLEATINIFHSDLVTASMGFAMMFEDMKKLKTYKVPRDPKDDLLMRFIRFYKHIERVLDAMTFIEKYLRRISRKRLAKKMKLQHIEIEPSS